MSCPACAKPLRTHGKRLCCDACHGIFLEHADFRHAIVELTQDEPLMVFVGEQPSARACPRCAHPMTTCWAGVQIAGQRKLLPPELDRCLTHGVWFDDLELAMVFEGVHAMVSQASEGHGRRLKVRDGAF